ncbi:MAG: GIY-YIG nuclease family protein [Alphaproteobacteria bacterium]
MIDQIPNAPGAYILYFNIRAPLRLDISALDFPLLAPGIHAYCGSARGPGGLRARIARHLRPDKSLHWHIDRLTAGGRVNAIAYTYDGSECALLARLLAGAGASIPIPGFGSSDCRRCPSHLVRIAAAPDNAFAPRPDRPDSEIAIVSVPS